MKKKGYYSSGEFARMANVTLRTIRYYDKRNILKPSFVSESGSRFYTDEDLVRLQQILLLKFLGFSLEDIREMTIARGDYHYLQSSLQLQKKLILDRIEQMELVVDTIDKTINVIDHDQQINWSQMLDLIHLTQMETSLKTQYQNSENISARIRLHKNYSSNKQGWFSWIYDQCPIQKDSRILEVGCGDGTFWLENINRLPPQVYIVLSDISEGILRDAKRKLETFPRDFSYDVADCHTLPYDDHSFDLIIANHVMFYASDIPKVCSEIKRVLKPEGILICSTYGEKHMKEITDLVQEFDSRIVLSGEKLYEHFGLENGRSILSEFFNTIDTRHYDDSIYIDRAEPLIEYILSCHGNQNQIILDRFKDFQRFVESKVKNGFSITKDAGIFLCKNC